MGIVFRQSIKTTIVIFAGAVLGAVVTFISPTYFRQAEYGYTKNLINQAAVAQLFILLGTGNLIYIFFPRMEGDHARKQVLFTIALMTPLAATVLLCIPYFLFREQFIRLYNPVDIPYVAAFYGWVPLFVLFWGYMTLLEAYLVTHMKVALAAFNREIVVRIGNLALIGLFILDLIDFYTFILGSIFIYLIPVLIMLVIARRQIEGFGASRNWSLFSRQEYREFMSFSWFHLFTSLSLNLIGFMDSLLVPMLDEGGMNSLAVYSIAVFITSIALIPYRAMGNAAVPMLNQAYSRNDQPLLENLYNRSAINILVVALAMFLLISCNLPNAIKLLPRAYADVSPLVMILLIGRVVDMITGFNSEMISVSKYYRFIFWLSLGLVAMIAVFMWLLVPTYGTRGAAWGVTLALVLFNIFKMWFLWARMRLQPFSVKSLVVIAAAVPAALVGFWLPLLGNAYLDTVVRSGLILLVYVGMLLWLRPSADLNTYLASIRKNKKLF